MQFDDYQSAARRTENTALTQNERVLDAAAGLSEEAGEVLGVIRKHLFQQRPLDRDALVAELGDALWCLATLATALDLSLGDVAKANITKLNARYPEGLHGAPSPRSETATG